MARAPRRSWFLGALVAFAGPVRAQTPVKSLAPLVEAAAPGARIELGEGRYAADLVVRKPLVFVGRGVGRTVLAGSLVLAAGGGAEALSVDGTDGNALVLRGETRLVDVAVRGADAAVVRVPEGARLTGREVALTCTGRAAAGLSIAGTVEVSKLSVDGPCRRGVDVQPAGEARLEALRITGSQDAGVRAVEAVLALSGAVVQMDPGSGSAALFAARTRLVLDDVRLSGGEQGALVRKGEARLTKVTVDGASAAGLAFVQAKAEVQGATLTGPFTHAAVQATEVPKLVLREIDVVHAGLAGLLAVRSDVAVHGMRLGGLVVDEDGDFGHGFVFERSTGDVSHATVSDAQGGLVWAAGSSRVTLDDVRGERVRLGLAAMGGADVKATKVTLAAGSKVGAVAWGRSRISIDHAFGEGAAFAACEGSTVALPAAESARVKPCSDDDLMQGGWQRGAD